MDAPSDSSGPGTGPEARHQRRSDRIRAQSLATASALFYHHGVRAVGMEQIVAESGIAKTTIYRHFPTKDALIEAFLEKEDAEFWEQWETAIGGSAGLAALERLAGWIGTRVQRDGYRGCPQINVAAEFADADHPARKVASRHKQEMARRLAGLCAGLSGMPPGPARAAALQIALLFDGAFTSGGHLTGEDAPGLLRNAVRKLAGASPQAG